MKKLVVFISGIILLGSFYNPVSGTNNINNTAIYLQNNKKVKIKATDLPQEVQNTLSKEYNGWTVTSNLYKIKSTSGSYYYQVEMQKELQTMTINFDENGKKLSDVDMS